MLSAIVLVALIYVYGSTPTPFTPESPTSPTNTPNLPDTLPNVSPMSTFKNYDDLKSFLTANTIDGSTYYGGGPLDAQFFGSSRGLTDSSIPTPAMSSGQESSLDAYSTTNIQVAGVDEADIVKTDGKYIYVAATNDYYSTDQNNLYILKADPQDPRVIAKITLNNNTYVAGLFLSQDSSKLVVLGSQYQVYAYDTLRPEIAMIYPYYSNVDTFINVYDISEKTHPLLARNFTLSGSYFNSRMIGDYVYAVVSQPAYMINDDVILPQVYQNAKASQITPERIYYADAVDNYFTFTTFIGLNILDDAQEPTNMTVMMGGASNMYVSLENIYVTYPTWSEQGQYTSIYRIRVNGSALTFEAKGNVTGSVLNQFSMDEYSGYFRIATNSWTNNAQRNNVYVLDMNLTTVGTLENLAEGENLHSVRFMGNKCYLVTFKKTDPLFVIDLGEPTAPKVLGLLKIPGYSDYLHPYDENLLIGVGKETVEASEGDFAWYQGVKLSLFDVSNVNDPKQLTKYVIGDRGTDSPILRDHKAFLFDKSNDGLLVIPVNLFDIDETKYPPGPSTYGTFVWQGAYVFNLTPTGGFVLNGNVTHIENQDDLYNGDNWVNRALYIGNTLYTVSNAKVKLNSLENLALIAEVALS